MCIIYAAVGCLWKRSGTCAQSFQVHDKDEVENRLEEIWSSWRDIESLSSVKKRGRARGSCNLQLNWSSGSIGEDRGWEGLRCKRDKATLRSMCGVLLVGVDEQGSGAGQEVGGLTEEPARAHPGGVEYGRF